MINLATGHNPSLESWKPKDILKDILECLDALRKAGEYGPFVVYHSRDWDAYLDCDYLVEVPRHPPEYMDDITVPTMLSGVLPALRMLVSRLRRLEDMHRTQPPQTTIRRRLEEVSGVTQVKFSTYCHEPFMMAFYSGNRFSLQMTCGNQN